MSQKPDNGGPKGVRGVGMGEAQREWPRLTAVLIAVAYAVIGIVWIKGSDIALHALAFSEEVSDRIEVWKGSGWVLFTAVCLYVLISRPLVRMTRARGRALRAQAEAQARAAELETVLDAVPAAVWIARDRECRVIEGNRVGRELLGQSERVNLSLSAPSGERLVGFEIMMGGRPVRAEDLPVQVAARTGEAVWNVEEELVFADGRRVPMLGNAVPLTDAEGRVKGAVGAFIDVTWRDEAMQTLHRNQLILEQAQQLGEIGSWVSDPAHHDGILTWSRETYRIFGLKVGEFDGSVESFFAMVHPEDREAVRKASLDAISGKSEYAIDHRIIRPDGAVRWVHERARVERDAAGEPRRMIGVCQDITARIEAETTLRASEARLRTALDAARMIGWETESGSGITTYSQDPVGFFGLEGPEGGLTPTGALDIVHPDAREEVLAEFNKALGGKQESVQTAFRSASPRQERWFLAIARIMRDATGQPLRIIGVTQEITAQREAEAARRASEERYRFLFNALPDPAWDWDAVADRTTHSATWPALLGYPAGTRPEETATWDSLLHPEDREAVLAHLETCVNGGTDNYEAEYRIRCVDGSYKWVMSRGRVVERDGEGRALRMIGGVTDMTQRRQAEQDLRLSEARYRKLIESAPEAIVVLDVEQKHFVDCNPQAGRLVGLTMAELLRCSPLDMSPEYQPDGRTSAEAAAEFIRQAIEGHEPQFEWMYKLKDGRLLPCETRLARLPDRDRVLVRGSIIDISERKLAEDALRASEEKYRLVLRATSDAMWDYEPRSGHLRWGDNVESMFGVPLEEMGNGLEGWSSRLHPEDRDRAVASFDRAITRGDSRWSAEYRFRKADGSYAVVLDRAYMQRGGDGGVIRIIGAMTDVTEHRHNEQLMAGQARTLELLVGGEPLERVLSEILKNVEALEPGCLGSVLLLNDDGRTVKTATAPTLPREYSDSLNGVAIGAGVGSCGTAMFERRRVIVSDIETDPLWAPYKQLALPHGLRACWSEPIFGAGDRVIGSLAMYYREARGPVERELETIEWAGRLAGLAIERRHSEDELKRRQTELRDILNAIPDLLFRMDKSGRYLDFHAPNKDDLAVPPEQFMGRTVRETLPRETAELCMVHVERVLRTGAPQTYEYQITGKRGLRHWEVRVTQCAEEQVLLLVRDITIRRTAERRLRESEQRLSLLVRQSPLGVIVWDLEFQVAEWNDAAEHIFGWPVAEALGRHAEFILPESVKPQVDDVWRALKANRGGSRSLNANVTRDGQTIYCEWYNSPLVDSDGRVFAIASIVDDVTEQRAAQQRQQLMMAELDHRVKNNLAAVISLAEQSGRTTTTFADFRVSFLGRVRALSRLHNALAATRWQGANLGTMVRQTLEAFGQDATAQAVVAGPTLVLPARAAQAMGMALNELCTNAIKYGSLSVPGGRVEARWAIHPPGTDEREEGDRETGPRRPVLQLLWAEHGGPAVSKPTRRGFGTELIEGAISYELGGSAVLRFAPEGLTCRIRVEMPEDAEFDPKEVSGETLEEDDG